MLPQNELTKTPLLDTMLAGQCSSATKLLDHTLSSLQGQVLEAVGPLSQLLEAVNDEDPQLSTDQIGKAVICEAPLFTYQHKANQSARRV